MFQIALVGSGSIVSTHVEALLSFPQLCKIVAICDIFIEKAQIIAEKYQLNCEIFDSTEKMLADCAKIDIVDICTPPFTHAELSILAMQAGKHIILEKPMAPTLAECDAMMQAERENHVILACIAQNRFSNEVYKLKMLQDLQIAGELKCAHINSLWWRGHNYYDLWWRGTWEKEGGGCTLNHAVHHIDMLNWMLGGLPTAVTAVLANRSHDNAEVEDLSIAVLEYANGAIAQATCSVVHHGEEQAVILQCEKAKLALPWSCAAMKQKENGFPSHDYDTQNAIQSAYEALADLPYVLHQAQLFDILNALKNGQKPLVTSQDGRNTVELVTAIYKAGFAKRTVSLPILPDDPYYTQQGKLSQVQCFHQKGQSVDNFVNDEISVGKLQ